MIGRREELAVFEAACTAVREGTGRCVLVTGEAGHRQDLARDHRTHARRARDLRRRGALIRGAALRPGRAGRCASACARRPTSPMPAGQLAPCLAPLLPGARVRGPECRGGDADRGAAARVRRAGRARAGRRRARRPPVGRRGDAAAAARAWRAGWATTPLLLVVTRARRGARRHASPAPPARGSCAAGASRSSIPLRPLERDDTARLGRGRRARGAATTTSSPHLHERAHGIPFYVEELAATLALDGRHADERRPAAARDACSTPCCCAPRRSRWRRATRSSAPRSWTSAATLERADGPPGGDALAEALAAGFLVEAGPGQPRVPARARARCDLRGDPVDAPPVAACVRRARARGRRCVRRRARRALARRRRGRARPRRRSRRPPAASASVYAYRDAAKLYERALDLGGGTETAALRAARAASPSARSWPAISPARPAPGARSSTAGGPRRGRERSPRREHAIGPRARAARQHRARTRRRGRRPPTSFAACGRLRGRGPLPARRCRDPARRRQPPPRAGRDRGRARRAPGRLAARAALAGALARGRGARQAGRDAGSAGERARGALGGARRRPAGDGRHGLPGARQSCTRTPASSARRARRSRSRSTTARAPGIDATGAICSACLCHVLRQRGEWRRSLAL